MQKLVSHAGSLFLSLYVLTYSIILPFSLTPMVLCFGDDGHIAIEPACSTYACGDPADRFDHLIQKHENLTGQETDCRDVALINVSSTLYLEKTTKLKNISEQRSTHPTAQISKPYSKVRSEFILKNISNKPALKNLQTTILLI